MRSITIKGAFLLCLLWNCTGISAQKQKRVTEIYYAIREDGTIDKKERVHIRYLEYDMDGSFIKGLKRTRKVDPKIVSEASEYYTLPLYREKRGDKEYDESDRMIRFLEEDGSDITEHLFSYNEWGDLEKHLIRYNTGQETCFTYDYFYPDDYTYAWKKGRRYISGTKKNFSSPWLLRTIKRDNVIVEHVERKINEHEN